MRKLIYLGYLTLVCAATRPAAATNYSATPANFAAVFMAAQSGDSITLSGNFGAVTLADKSFAVPLRIDASAATFSDSLLIENVQGVAFTGGYFGSTSHTMRLNAAVAAYADADISFANAYVAGAQTGTGIAYMASTGLSVTGSTFDGLHSGLDFGSSSGATLDRNRSINSAGDGFDIANAHLVTVTNLTCTGGSPSAGAHPDCVQLYSLMGDAPQSDITITNNVAHGPTQGFTSFNSEDGGGLRINISYNTVETTEAQGIACYACVDSSFLYNTLTTLPGAEYRTGINIKYGSDDLIYGNTVDGQNAPDDPSPTMTADLSPDLTAELGWTPTTFLGDVTSSAFGDKVSDPRVSAVPEPGPWVLMLAGFGTVGAAVRRRHRAAIPA